MALATRIIPVLLHRDGCLVKGIKFNSWRTSGHALQAARIHQARGVDEMLVLDVAATPSERWTDIALIEHITAGCFMPVTAGGGVRNIDDVKRLLRAGADKVAIHTAIYTQPGIIRTCANALGSQAIVAVIETLTHKVRFPGCDWTTLDPVDQAIYLEHSGAGEILLMSVDNDGTLEGYDLPVLERVARAVEIPVIAAGGAGTYRHMHQAINAGASAVAAGAMFQWTEHTPMGAAKYLRERGVEVRIPEERCQPSHP